MAVSTDRSHLLRGSSFASLCALILVFLATSASAQTQASCQFTTFNRLFVIPGGNRLLVPRGINDYSTVVGDAQDNTDFSVRGFTRSSGNGITYYRNTSNGTPGNTTFTGRTNVGLNIGVADSSTYTYLASASGTPFTLQGSTFIPLTMTIVGGTTHNQFTVWGINQWGTSVGAFKDWSGKMQGFKRYSDGKGIALDYPGAVETVATGINDSGTIVGWYSRHLPPTEWRHGFIYSNGNWATLDYPSTQQTSLDGISNASLIVGNTIKGTNETGSFLYQSGAFKSIVLDNSGGLVTAVRGVSPNKGLITGFNGHSGFIATCK